MEPRYKLYPYPVLSPHASGYKRGIFKTQISVERESYGLRISFDATLTSGALSRLLGDHSVKYAYRLECAQTGYRRVVLADTHDKTCRVENKLLAGKLEISSFIVAVRDIARHESDEFHADYAGASFAIEAGSIMAVGNTFTVDVSQGIDDLADATSIFIVVRNADNECKEMTVDMSTRKLTIKLPEEDYRSYKKLATALKYQSVLNSLTVAPALAYVLGELQRMTAEERAEKQECLWYKAIDRFLDAQFNCGLETKAFRTVNVLELAQRMVKAPLGEAFQILASSFGVSGGDEA